MKAVEFGTVEAYSAIAKAMQPNGSDAAIEDNTKRAVDVLEKIYAKPPAQAARFEVIGGV